jgi:phage host-nuclease inhibitor protein Gam
MVATTEELKEKIAALGDKIKALKSAAQVDKEAVGAAVKEMLDLKGEYAVLNNGIGVDGKPYEDHMNKKKKEKGAAAMPVRRLVLMFCVYGHKNLPSIHSLTHFLRRKRTPTLPMQKRRLPRRLLPRLRRLP